MNKRKLGKASRRRGHDFERKIVKELKELGFKAGSSRSESRSMDSKGVDIISEDFPFYVQCKCSCNSVNYGKLLSVIPDEKIPVVFHRKTKRRDKNFIVEGEVKMMRVK